MHGTGETLLESKNDLSVAQRNTQSKISSAKASLAKRVLQDANWPSKRPWPRCLASFIPEVGVCGVCVWVNPAQPIGGTSTSQCGEIGWRVGSRNTSPCQATSDRKNLSLTTRC